jgi:hypothetical protein
MNQLAHLTHFDDLPLGHRLALAAGAGVWLTGEDERISTAQERVALAVPALVRLRTSALLADAAPEPVAGESELALESAGALRLLDRALAVRGRDHGYLTDAWCQHAHVAAHLAIHAAGREVAREIARCDRSRQPKAHRSRDAIPIMSVSLHGH